MTPKYADPQGHIDFDRPTLERFKGEVAKAQANGKREFKFDGMDVVTNYGKYLAEYVEGLLKQNGL